MPVLPRELVSLVHHVQLNQTGWWDAAVERLVLATLWRAASPVTPAELPELVAQNFGVRLPVSATERCIQRLASRNEVLALPDRRLKLPEAKAAAFEAMRVEGERREAHVRSKFRDALEAVGCACDPESTWATFQEKWLQPTVAAAGARTYELVGGAPEDWMAVGDVSAFTAALPAEERGAARDAVAQFFDPGDATLRAYLLTLMDAYFVVEAGGLSTETIAAINTLTAKKPSFVAFVDTNSAFSILGLHGAAAKAAAEGVLSVAQDVGARGVQVKLYVTPHTVEEATRVLQHEMETLARLRIMPNMAGEILAHGQLTGVYTAFVEAVLAAGRPIRAEDFLGPYVRDLKTILRSKGVELYNDPLESVMESAGVARDIEEQYQFEQEKYKARGKSRGALRHDVVLWHFVNGKRPARIDSPSDAHYWVLTEDRRLMSFDAHKRRHEGVPICLHPLALAQVLEFWSGRTEGTAAALVGGLRLAMLSPHLGVESERTTIAIIAALSRYEGVGDLPPETIAHLLVNDALRQKLTDAATPEAEFELVRDELVTEHQRAVEERTKATGRAAELEQQLALEERGRLETEQRASAAAEEAEALRRQLAEIDRARADNDERVEQLESKARDSAEREAQLTTALSGVNSRLEAFEAAEARRREADAAARARRSVLMRWVVVPLVAIVAVAWALLRHPALDGTFWGDPRVGWGIVFLLVAAWSWVAHRRANRDEKTRAWWVTTVLKAVWMVLGTVGIFMVGPELVGSALYDRSGLKPNGDAPPLGEMRRQSRAQQPSAAPSTPDSGAPPVTVPRRH